MRREVYGMPAQRTSAQGRYWVLTVRGHLFMPHLPAGVAYVKGQLELGGETGYLHWQMFWVFKKKIRLGGVKAYFAENVHAELSRSEAVEEYVWKEETSVENTRFELGAKPFQRSRQTDWDAVKKAAQEGRLDTSEIPSDVYVRCYSTLTRIQKDHLKPTSIEREVRVYVGPTGVGKSRRAWDEAGLEAYPKDPNTKFWDGYAGQENVVCDEFRGKIDISNILRWTDRYPVAVETKGSGVVFKARRLWITSNLHPRFWYPELDEETKAALMRRLYVEVMNEPYYDDIE